jgi:hypothetical protein
MAQMLGSSNDSVSSASVEKAAQAPAKVLCVTPEIRRDVISMCKSLGVRVVGAPYEADGQLAWEFRAGRIDMVYTVDGDLLALGCRVLRPADPKRPQRASYPGQALAIRSDGGGSGGRWRCAAELGGPAVPADAASPQLRTGWSRPLGLKCSSGGRALPPATTSTVTGAAEGWRGAAQKVASAALRAVGAASGPAVCWDAAAIVDAVKAVDVAGAKPVVPADGAAQLLHVRAAFRRRPACTDGQGGVVGPLDGSALGAVSRR